MSGVFFKMYSISVDVFFIAVLLFYLMEYLFLSKCFSIFDVFLSLVGIVSTLIYPLSELHLNWIPMCDWGVRLWKMECIPGPAG